MIVRVYQSSDLNLSSSYACKELSLTNYPDEIETFTGSVVLNKNMRVLPELSNWLGYELSHNFMSIKTADTYGKSVGYFLDYLVKRENGRSKSKIEYPEEVEELLLTVNKSTIKEYLMTLKEEGKQNKTIALRDAAIGNLFNNHLCMDKGNKDRIRENNPYEHGFLYKGPKHQKIVSMCSVDELTALMRVTKSERERVLLQFMMDSGLRVSEVPRVTKRDIEQSLNYQTNVAIIDDETISVRSGYSVLKVAGSKGRKREIKERETIVSIATLTRLQRYHSTPLYRKYARIIDNPPAFMNSHGEPISASSISKLIYRLTKKAINRDYINRNISPHMLRHGFAGLFLRGNDIEKEFTVRLKRLSNCLGHANISTTETSYSNIPYDIAEKMVDLNGKILNRAQIMEKLWLKTKLKIGLKDKK